MFISLPSDCHDIVLSFLPLKDVIQLGATSIRSLSDIQNELKRRRQRFNQRFCYISTSNRPNKAQLYAPGLGDIHLLPTVRDRIDSLATVLSTSHHCYRHVAELRAAVANAVDLGTEPGDTLEITPVLCTHINNTRAHKLHALILSKLISSNPSHVDFGQPNGDADEGALTVTLERYVGDVLCLFYLLGHADAGIIEASSDEIVWRSRIMSDLTLVSYDTAVDQAVGHDEAQTLQGVSMAVWYRAWIFVQSSLLRVAPFTWHHQVRLGIASPTPTVVDTAAFDVAHGSLLRPHLPFSGGRNVPFWRRLLTITNFPAIRVTFTNFPPLGPTFRGRDMIESHVLHLSTVVGTVICFESMDPHEYSRGPTTQFRPFLQHWASGQESVIQCLLQQHEQIRRTRPMTVVPPLVTLRPIVY